MGIPALVHDIVRAGDIPAIIRLIFVVPAPGFAARACVPKMRVGVFVDNHGTLALTVRARASAFVLVAIVVAHRIAVIIVFLVHAIRRRTVARVFLEVASAVAIADALLGRVWASFEVRLKSRLSCFSFGRVSD
eukprot:COSAG02_NODE_13570_length_1377_cov_2.158842_1_plen_134_part_00